MKSIAKRILAYLVLILFLALSCIIRTPLVLLFYLLFGWVAYLIRVMPQMQINWPGVASAVLSLVGALVLGQVVGSWLWRETAPAEKRSIPKWKWSWTVSGIAIVVLMFTCGIAAVGITHQSAWLARSDEPLLEFSGRETGNRIKCAAQMRAIGFAIDSYATDHGGKLPETMEELVISNDLSANAFICPSSNDEPATATTPAELLEQLRKDDGHVSFVYHGRGLKMPLPKDRVILCEPLMNHGNDGMNALFGDLTVRWLSQAEAQTALQTIDK